MVEATDILLTVGSILVILLVLAITVLSIHRNKLTLEQSLQELNTNIARARKIMDQLPESKYASVFEQIMNYASIGVAQAEQLYKIRKIEGTARKNTACQFVHESLSLAGVKCTPEVESVIDSCIEAAVQRLGHQPEALNSSKASQ